VGVGATEQIYIEKIKAKKQPPKKLELATLVHSKYLLVGVFVLRALIPKIPPY
jgi:hypothetical protein